MQKTFRFGTNVLVSQFQKVNELTWWIRILRVKFSGYRYYLELKIEDRVLKKRKNDKENMKKKIMFIQIEYSLQNISILQWSTSDTTLQVNIRVVYIPRSPGLQELSTSRSSRSAKRRSNKLIPAKISHQTRRRWESSRSYATPEMVGHPKSLGATTCPTTDFSSDQGWT